MVVGMTATSIALDSAARGTLTHAELESAVRELVDAGSPSAAMLLLRACLLSAGGHLSADTCPDSGHLSG